ncbi:hypothetical protein B0H12DRAFT_1012975, partial [Mycena haematopus]
VDEQTTRQLEDKLAKRPDKSELIERNILKGKFRIGASCMTVSDLCVDDKGLAPGLVAAREKLQRSQLEVCSF